MDMVRAPQLILAAAALAALSACATPEASGPGLAAADPGAPTENASIYGLYLAGQAALDSGDTRSASELFGKAGMVGTPSILYCDQAGAVQLAPGVPADIKSFLTKAGECR